MASVTLRVVRKDRGPLHILSDIDLDVTDKEFITLVGPSGCGKSTLLRMIAGLEAISGDEVLIGGQRGALNLLKECRGGAFAANPQ